MKARYEANREIAIAEKSNVISHTFGKKENQGYEKPGDMRKLKGTG